MEIRLDDKHKYTIDTIKAIGVNELIQSHGLGLDIDSMCPTAKENFENARVRGGYAHTMAKLHLQGKLNEATLDPQLFPYLVGLKKLMIDHKIEPIAIEEKIGFKTLLICGTPDIRCKFDGVEKFLDWKFVKVLGKYYHLQMGGYRYIHNANIEEPEKEIGRGLIIQILPNDYKIEEEDFDAESEFENLLMAHHIKRKYREV